MHRPRPILVVLSGILLLAVSLAAAALALDPVKPPRIKITAGLEKTPIEYNMQVKKWNGAATGSSHYREVLFEKVLGGTLPTVDARDKITFHFGYFKPDQITLVADYYTSPVLSTLSAPVPVQLEGYSFHHPAAQTGYPAYSGPRFYVLTCTWGENEAQYAFAVNLINEEEESWPEADLSTLEPARVRQLRISPLMSSATSVEDVQGIKKAISLLQSADLRPLSPGEAARLQAEDPGSHTVEGTTYSRNILVDIFFKDNPGGMLTIHLYGNMIKLGNGYFQNDNLTNDFIVLLNELHAASRGVENETPGDYE